MRTTFAFLALTLVCAPASADVAGPNDHLCTVELQQQDGSECGSCTWTGFEAGAAEAACGHFEERGWTSRCGFGATQAHAIYCDREADFVDVGDDGCGCRVGGKGRAPGWLALALLGLVWIRARRCRVA